MYHNTIPITGEHLSEKVDKVLTQDQVILNLFRRYKRFSPSQIYMRQFAGRCPLTSVRRSINTLTKNGFLQKTGEMIPGMYGDPENVWELVDNQLRLF